MAATRVFESDVHVVEAYCFVKLKQRVKMELELFDVELS